MSQALLPEDLEEHTIQHMLVGESAYTVPWAMWTDGQRRCWLHPSYTIHGHPGGTVEMRIEKRQDGYYVAAQGTRHRWSSANSGGYVGGEDLQFIPVAGWIRS